MDCKDSNFKILKIDKNKYTFKCLPLTKIDQSKYKFYNYDLNTETYLKIKYKPTKIYVTNRNEK